MDNIMLQHHGIRGQRWGVRRYQNPDGSLTKAGLKKLEKMKLIDNEEVYERMRQKQMQSNTNGSEKNQGNQKNKEPQYTNEQQHINEPQRRTNETPHYSDKPTTTKVYRTVEDMTDDELRRGLGRLQMEKQYNKLIAEQSNQKTGRDYVKKMIDDGRLVADASDTIIRLYNNGEKLKNIATKIADARATKAASKVVPAGK